MSKYDREKSNEHMLLKCPVRISFWRDVEKWFAQLSDSGYNVRNYKNILGDLENSKASNHIILFGKVCIHKSKLNDK